MRPSVSMRLPVVVVLVIAAVSVAGCSQADGPVPLPDGDVPNRIEDLARDLQNLEGGGADASRDLADDLKVFVEGKAGAGEAIDSLSQACAKGLAGRPLDGGAAAVLARQLWLTVASRELSDKQTETLQADVRAAATGAGMAAEGASAVAAEALNVQRVVTSRQRRWYEFF